DLDTLIDAMPIRVHLQGAWVDLRKTGERSIDAEISDPVPGDRMPKYCLRKTSLDDAQKTSLKEYFSHFLNTEIGPRVVFYAAAKSHRAWMALEQSFTAWASVIIGEHNDDGQLIHSATCIAYANGIRCFAATNNASG